MKLTKRQRYCSIGLACLQNMTSGGVFFGWASISGTLLTGSKEIGGTDLTREYVHMMFIVSSFFSFLGPLVLGVVLDFYGPRICSIISLFLICIGSVLFSISDVNKFPLFIPAMCLIAFGGPGAQSSIIHVSNLFPKWKATATAVITGSFQLSFVIFLGFDQLWLFYKIDYTQLFQSYCAICVINILVSSMMWPDKPYSHEEQVSEESDINPEEHLGLIRLPSVFIHHSTADLKNENDKLSIEKSNSTTSLLKTESSHNRSDNIPLKNRSFFGQISSIEFITLTIFFLINSFFLNFYLGSFDIQMEDSQVLPMGAQHNFARLFTIICTAGVIAIPFIGGLMDRVGFPITSFIIVGLGVGWSATVLLASTPWTLILSFVLNSLYRTFLFTFIFAYLADRLGFTYFGVLAGLMFASGGFLGFLQYPLAKYAAGTCHLNNDLECDNGRWYVVHTLALICIAFSGVFCYVDWKYNGNKKNNEKVERKSKFVKKESRTRDSIFVQQNAMDVQDYGAMHPLDF